MTLIPVVIKRSRVKNTFKFWGGILNSDKKYYTRRVTSKTNPLPQLEQMK